MRILLTITIALTFFAMPVLAETINVRAGDHGSFSRVVFDWPYRVGYRLERQSGDVIVVFDRGAAVNFAPYRRIDPIHAGPIEALDLDPLIVRIAADPMAEIENFRMNTKIVIDIRAVTMDMPKAVVDPEDVLPITEALERAGIEIEPLPPELAIIEEEPVTEAEAEAEPEPEIVLELEPVPDPTEIFNDFID
ncbi:MAG: hypothetical protein U9N14_00720, partial [Pseudomonadota bacterium]|nr:hypothetical protein [Pseudomonadota bacterium]